MRPMFRLMTVPLYAAIFCSCNGDTSSGTARPKDSTTVQYNGFSSEIAYGRHLVEITGCGDCHTPKKMTATGPVPDTALLLSGHPASMPSPDFDPGEAAHKGLAATNDMTAWVGPWGVSFASNLTPDQTGIGNWNEAEFVRAIREGKFKGLQGARPLLPPMPWQDFALMKDEELRAVFAYLKSIKPISNVVPAAILPVAKSHH